MIKNQVKVSIVIPTWNGLDYLKKCLGSLTKQTFKDFETIVIDNGSTDGTVDYLKQFYKQVNLITLPKNVGFAPAVNKGIQSASGKYILLLNNDTEVKADCLNYLVKTASKHPEVSFIAAKTLNYFDRQTIDSAGDYIDIVGHANNIGMGQKDGPEFSQEQSLFLASGGATLFSKTLFDKVGLLDEDYFAYFEDVDLCLRAQLQGFRGWYQPQAVVYHIHKATSDRIKPFREYLQFRNMTMTVIKDFPKGLLMNNFNWLKIILVNLNTIRFLINQGYAKEAFKAEGYIICHLLTILKKRQQIQSQKVVSDQYIIDNVVSKKIKLFKGW